MPSYQNTSVPIERSQAKIRELLKKHGARQFAFGEAVEGDGRTWAVMRFEAELEAGPATVRMRVPHKPLDEERIAARAERATRKTPDDFRREAQEQEAKRIWRVVFYNLKARMEAVEEGVETFYEAFLSHLLDPRTGRTVYEELSETGRLELAAPLPKALPAAE